MTAITKKTQRNLDFYPTPSFAVKALLDRHSIEGSIFECCAGKLDIVRALNEFSPSNVFTGDIDTSLSEIGYYFDARSDSGWNSIPFEFDWVITNPPYNCADEIIPLAFDHAKVGVAMLLRLSWLEPCKNRSKFLSENILNSLIVLPRISFTGDGKTDSVTSAWFVWEKASTNSSVSFVSRY